MCVERNTSFPPRVTTGCCIYQSSVSDTPWYREPEEIGLETIRSPDPLDVDVGDVAKEIHGEYCVRCGIFSGGTWESDLSSLVLAGHAGVIRDALRAFWTRQRGGGEIARGG